MKIAVVHSFYAELVPSGENTVVRDQVAALAEAGHTVELFARQSTESSEKLPRKARAAFRVATGFGDDPGADLARFAPDVVHIHNLHPNWGARWVSQYADRTVATLHNFRPVCSSATLFRDGQSCVECLEHGTTRALTHRCYRGSSLNTLPLAIASRSRGSKHPLMSRLSAAITLNTEAQNFWQPLFPDMDFTLVPNFVRTGSVSVDEPKYWLYGGRLTEDKGVAWLLANWPADEPLVIAGAGPLQGLVEAHAAARPEVTYAGKVSRPELLTLLSDARALILPSLWAEGLPTVALEAVAAATPVIASNRASGLGPLVASGGGAWLDVNEGEVGLAARLSEVSADQAGFSRRAVATHATNYSTETWLARIEAVYERLAHRRNEAGRIR